MGRGLTTGALRLLILALLVSALFVQPAGANPAPDPTAFNPFPTYGLALAPAGFTSGNLDYTLTLSSGAYLLYGSAQYPITLVWGFYAVNKTGNSANNFGASGPDIGEWGWDQKPAQGNVLSVGGWLDSPKKEALETPLSGSVSKLFSYSHFAFTGPAPSLGLHVSVSIPDGKPSPFGGGVTGNIIPTPVPEPATIVALLGGLLGFAYRRRR